MEGRTLFGKYKVLRQIARGGTSIVYLAENINLGNKWAIKCVDKSHLLYQDILNESYILKNLQHPAIPMIIDVEEDKQYLYIIEEYIEGESLKNFRLNQKNISERQIINYAIQICEVIKYLHSREPNPIIYKDLKPENIIINNNQIKIIDFGLSVPYDKANNSKYPVGTIGYAAPEQYTMSMIDERTDIFSIGMILYFLVTGVKFTSNSKVLPLDKKKCSREIKKIIDKCISIVPADRYQSVQELLNAIHNISSYQKDITLSYNKSIYISLSGSQNRLGVTHTAIAIANYLQKQDYKVLLLEKNKSNHFLELLNRQIGVEILNNTYRFNGCYYYPYYQDEVIGNIDQYDFIIQDYGLYRRENISEFMNSDVKLMLVGAKDWELDYSERMLNDFQDLRDVKYLFNLIDYKTYKLVLKNMKNSECIKIPYQPNPFELTSLSNEAFDNIFKDIIRRTKRFAYRRVFRSRK